MYYVLIKNDINTMGLGTSAPLVCHHTHTHIELN